MENTVNPSVQQDPEVQDGKFFAAIGYMFILCFVPILLKKQNKFAQFHGKQALVLFILEIAVLILKWVPFIGDLVSTIGCVAFAILSLVGIMKVLMGEYWEMPIVYDIANRITL